MSAVDRALAVLGARARRDEPIGPLTTYRAGGRAAVFLEIRDDEDLARLARAVQVSELPMLVVGNGSNLLVADAGFPGIAVRLGAAFNDVDLSGTEVRAGGAALLPVVARRTASAGLRGFEWAVGVPGSIGGAVRMNAGGHGSDMARSLWRARVFDLRSGDDTIRTPGELELGYRSSALTAAELVVWAELRLRPGDPAEAEAEIAEIVRWRRTHQPGGANAGSVFTNPPGDAAGHLIEAAGCKGLRCGSAQVSTKHANFIQVDGGGSADDVVRCMRIVQERVFERFGVRLVPETRLVGFPDLNSQQEVES